MTVAKLLGITALAAATLALTVPSTAGAYDRYGYSGRDRYDHHDRYDRGRNHGRHRAHPVRVCHMEWRHHHRVRVCRVVYR